MIYSPEHLEEFLDKHRYHKMHSETAYSGEISDFKTYDYAEWSGHREDKPVELKETK